MFVINFKKQFVSAIESGAKKQTIRAIRKDKRQPEIGDILRLYTGMRTKGCRRIADVVCTEVYPIKIYDDGVNVFSPVESIVFEPIENDFSLNRFAELDGFKSWEEMREWFGKIHGLPFNGILIRWKFEGMVK